MVKNYFNRIIRKINKKHGQEIDPEDIFLDSSNLAGLDTDRMEGTLDKPISRVADLAPSFLLAIIFLVFAGQLYNLQVKNYSTYKDKLITIDIIQILFWQIGEKFLIEMEIF